MPKLIEEGANVADLHNNSWVSLRIVRHPDVGVNGYVYSHESRCQGRIVATTAECSSSTASAWRRTKSGS